MGPIQIRIARSGTILIGTAASSIIIFGPIVASHMLDSIWPILIASTLWIVLYLPTSLLALWLISDTVLYLLRFRPVVQTLAATVALHHKNKSHRERQSEQYELLLPLNPLAMFAMLFWVSAAIMPMIRWLNEHPEASKRLSAEIDLPKSAKHRPFDGTIGRAIGLARTLAA